MVVLNHQYGLARTVTARYFGTGDGSRVAFNLAGMDSDVAYVAPSIYVTDWRGGARTNLVLQSQTLGTSWTATGTSVSADVSAAPDGSTTMDKIAETAVSSEHYIEQTITSAVGTWTISAYVKAAERTKGYLTAVHVGESATTSAILFDIAAGAITGASQRVTATGIQNMGGGIYRIWATFTTTSACSSLRFRLQCADATPQASYLGVLGSGYYAWGLQFESGSTATPYTPTTTAAVTVYDVSPTLLYSTARTNLALQSQTLGTTWVVTDLAVVTADATVAPDGSSTADKITELATTAAHYIKQTVAQTNTTVYTHSVYLKAAERTWGVVSPLGLASGSAWFNLVTGVVGTVQVGLTSAAITSVGNGWYRCSVTYAASGTTTGISILMATGDTNLSYLGVLGSGIYIWGSQLETGTTATPYIPTTTAAASLTDYSLHATSGAVTFASAPAASSTLAYKQPWAPSSNVYMRFGTGDGTSTVFSLPYAPVTPLVYIAGVLKTVVTDYNIAPNGVCTFVVAPAGAASLTWTGSMGPMP